MTDEDVESISVERDVAATEDEPKPAEPSRLFTLVFHLVMLPPLGWMSFQMKDWLKTGWLAWTVYIACLLGMTFSSYRVVETVRHFLPSLRPPRK